MPTASPSRRELEKSLRFARIWTALNALAAAGAAIRVATAPGVVRPAAAAVIIGAFVVVCGVGLWRMKTLQDQLRG